MMKRYISLVLILAFGLSLLACSNTTPPLVSDTSFPNGSSASETTSETTSEAASDESADTSEESEEELVLDGSKLIVFGDSITALGSWGNAVAEKCNMEYFNGARGGITSLEGLARFNAFVASREPDFVTLCFGMNDLLMVEKNKPKCTPEEFSKNLEKLVENTRSVGAVPLIVTTNPLDVDVFFASQGQSPDLYGGRDILEWLDTYNEAAREVAKKLGCDLIDVRKACEDHEIKSVVNPDGIHLSALGNEIFAETISNYLLENFKTDPNAPKVDRDNAFDVEGEVELLPFEADKWYFEPSGAMIIRGGEKLVLQNTNSLWPDAQCSFDKWYRVDVKTAKLSVKLKNANVSSSVIIYFDGATPNAYADGQYLILNPYFNCKTDSFTGDITPNQTVDIEIPLTSLPISSSCIHDGKVTISGCKIYVAGAAYQNVIVESFKLSE